MVRPRCGSRVHSLPLCQYSVHMRRKQQHLSASLMIRLLGASFFLPLNQGCSKQVSKLLSGPAQYSATAPTMRWKREAFKMRNLLNGWSCRKVMEAVVFFLCDCEWLRIKKGEEGALLVFFSMGRWQSFFSWDLSSDALRVQEIQQMQKKTKAGAEA